MQRTAECLSPAAGILIIRSAGRDRNHAGAGSGDVILAGRGEVDLGGCSGTGEDEDDECADDIFHGLVLMNSRLD